MRMAIAKVTSFGKSRAVRLPDDFRVADTEFNIQKVGRSLVLTPANANWSDFFSMLQEFESDKPVERNQPENSIEPPDIL
jgi:virulence-associated protein VagC